MRHTSKVKIWKSLLFPSFSFHGPKGSCCGSEVPSLFARQTFYYHGLNSLGKTRQPLEYIPRVLLSGQNSLLNLPKNAKHIHRGLVPKVIIPGLSSSSSCIEKHVVVLQWDRNGCQGISECWTRTHAIEDRKGGRKKEARGQRPSPQRRQ